MKPLEVGVGAGAAVITAFASSYLGTAGTLTGAAVASVVGTVSTSVLRTSAENSAERLRHTTARLRETRTGTMPQPTDVHPVEGGADEIDPYGTQLFGAPNPEAAAAPPTPGRRPGRKQWLVLSAGVVIAFAAALVLITGIESAAGKPLSALVGNSSGGGTTIGRATGTDSGSTTKTTPAPTPASTASTTGEPTATATDEPSATPTGEPSATEPTPAPTTAVPSVSAPAPTVAPSATPNPLTSESPQASTTP